MNKTVLITGSSRGIGRAIAIKLSDYDYKIVVNYKEREDKANEVVDLIRAKSRDCIAIKADISDTNQVKEMFKEIENKFGYVNYLVNNAGISQLGLFQDIDYKEWRNIFAVNVDGMFNCTKNALPHMISEKCGKIINIASIWGLVGGSFETAYSATKGAVIAFTKSLAKELGPSNINVNCIAPGAIMTDMLSIASDEALQRVREETPLERIGKVEDIAETAAFLLSESANFYTGQILSPNGGLVIN